MTEISHLLEAKRALHASEDAERDGNYREAILLALHAIKHLHAWAVDLERAYAEQSIAVRNVSGRAENGK